MKNLLSGWMAEEKAEFYRDVQPPDYTAAERYFRVTDTEMLKALLGNRVNHRLTGELAGIAINTEKIAGMEPKKLPLWLKRQKYNFVIKWLREFLLEISPWGHRDLKKWMEEFAPDVLVYMVGESIFMDRMVMQTCSAMRIPLVLYNGEAYRIIDLRKRHGIERLYYKKCEQLYAEMSAMATLEIYNSEMLKVAYEKRYRSNAKRMIAYNSADCEVSEYVSNKKLSIVYFGNLGVGRVSSLLEVAEALWAVDTSLYLDVYGKTFEKDENRLRAERNIRFHGFISAQELKEIIECADILLHVESFDPAMTEKLKYAFSTKIAQCLCAGRCLVSYAPKGTASTQYLLAMGAVLAATTKAELRGALKIAVKNKTEREKYARLALEIGMKNHNTKEVAQMVRHSIEEIIENE